MRMVPPRATPVITLRSGIPLPSPPPTPPFPRDAAVGFPTALERLDRLLDRQLTDEDDLSCPLPRATSRGWRASLAMPAPPG
jgi:hypothetical protein